MMEDAKLLNLQGSEGKPPVEKWGKD